MTKNTASDCTVVKYTIYNPNIYGSNRATGIGRDVITLKSNKKIFFIFRFFFKIEIGFVV